jgi:hypothetical protein
MSRNDPLMMLAAGNGLRSLDEPLGAIRELVEIHVVLPLTCARK